MILRNVHQNVLRAGSKGSHKWNRHFPGDFTLRYDSFVDYSAVGVLPCCFSAQRHYGWFAKGVDFSDKAERNNRTHHNYQVVISRKYINAMYAHFFHNGSKKCSFKTGHEKWLSTRPQIKCHQAKKDPNANARFGRHLDEIVQRDNQTEEETDARTVSPRFQHVDELDNNQRRTRLISLFTMRFNRHNEHNADFLEGSCCEFCHLVQWTRNWWVEVFLSQWGI